MTVWIAVTCPSCNSTDVIRNGTSRQGKQRYLCRNQECPRCTFILDYSHNGYKPEVKQKITEMAVNGSGSARYCQSTFNQYSYSDERIKKKESKIEKVNRGWLESRNTKELEVTIQKVEVDEMESYVGKKL